MAHAPSQSSSSFHFQPVPSNSADGPRESATAEQLPFGTNPPIQYEFIVQTGDESTATTKRKLKTVRSHVMKNYLQHKGSSSSSLATRRIGKQRARSSRSQSRDTEGSTSPGGMRARSASASTELGPTSSATFIPTPLGGSANITHANHGEVHLLTWRLELILNSHRLRATFCTGL
jgi:hypothetical protein